MSEEQVIPVKPEIAAKALIDAKRYQEMAARAASDPGEEGPETEAA